jgi:hypothetical protein
MMRAEIALSCALTWKAIFFGGNDHAQERNLEGGPQAEPAIIGE